MNQKGDDQYVLFFNNELWYCFFRYHYILCERLAKMQKESDDLIEQEIKENSQNKSSYASTLALKNDCKFFCILNFFSIFYINVKILNFIAVSTKTEDYFKTLIHMVKQVLDGNLESTVYEDNVREMYGIKAYITFTLDKLVQNIVKQVRILDLFFDF